MFQKKRIVFLALIFFIPHALSWGFVAAIAQNFLFPNVLEKVIELLPVQAHENLAYIAAWADQIKHKEQYRFTSPMHYTNPSPLYDNPPSHCAFDWDKKKVDLISAIHNYSNRLDPNSDLNYWSRAEALRFLVHFIGDLHQPLHRKLYISKRIREFNQNSTIDYNLPEDYSQFNSSEPLFDGQFYDLYLKYIINLMNTTWRGELSQWTICNEDFKLSTELPLSGPNQLHFSSASDSSDYFHLSMNQEFSFSAACPEYWAIPLNKLNCQVVLNGYDRELDLSIGEYYEKIVKYNIMEKLLAISGYRIAAVLNTILK
ncbi:15934_t:CDS:2 [Dentiscutata erythropus]|uniref:15934_t:CDS:1 n=1 Tax=Dentiscutata erythropus TaxID=1348616 RepID=A0A9N8VZD2_9GLOM|nr:15934_t:CDS:2 [Dentiscutata erythropus]